MFPPERATAVVIPAIHGFAAGLEFAAGGGGADSEIRAVSQLIRQQYLLQRPRLRLLVGGRVFQLFREQLFGLG